MRKRIKKFAFVICLLLLTGCGKKDVIVIEEADQVALNAVVMLGIGNPVAEVFESICNDFRSNNPEINLVAESKVSDENWKYSVAADFCVGNEPDVIQFFTDATANQLIKMDKFVTLEEIRQEYPEYADNIYEWALDQVANHDGVRRAVPTTGFWEGLFCNKDIFEEYNVPLPTDIVSFENAILKFREVGIIPVACSISNVPHYWTEHLLLTTLGPQKYTGPFIRVTPEWEAGLERLAEYREMGAFPENTDTIDNSYASELFINKKAAMILEGNWFLSNIRDTENTIVLPFPGLWKATGESKIIVGGMTSGFYISRRAWNNPLKRDAAVKFVMANTSVEAIEKYWASGGGITTTATPVTVTRKYNPLEHSAMDYISNADGMVLSTDSRIEPEAYRELISGMLEVSNGGSANSLLERVLKTNNMNKKR
ncbi:MAG: ABC transporter substrate-binding protein [Lachnospiraceae bacterium]|nr:ABC transporter substrate-binding protein [Lachnospiraceae bacterium]